MADTRCHQIRLTVVNYTVCVRSELIRCVFVAYNVSTFRCHVASNTLYCAVFNGDELQT
jgi:hypothetical protein